MLAAGPDLASTSRIWLLRRDPFDLELVARWRASCDARFEALVGETPGAEQRYRHGTYTFAYAFEPGVLDLSLAEVGERLAEVEGYTGWRPWWVPTSDFPPRVVDGALECWMFGDRQLFADPAHSDYWRVSAAGCSYLRRGYEEDSTDAHEGGRVFSDSLAIWRVAEALLHVGGFARTLGLASHQRVGFEARWSGLRGRALSSWPERLARSHDAVALTEVVDAATSFELSELVDDDDLVPIVNQLVAPLYERFEGRRPTSTFIAEQVERLRAR